MKYSDVVGWIVMGAIILFTPLSGLALDEQKEESTDPGHETNNKQAVSRSSMPVYKPPLRGAPASRIGGGTRGIGSDMPVLAALVPDHTGLTIGDQPSLYWYISEPTNHFVEFTLIDEQSIQPLAEKRIPAPVQAGVHCVRLADYGLHLSPGKKYRWFVALVPDPDRRSKDLIAGGTIELVAFPKTVRAKVSEAKRADTPHIYAEAGIWYDALSAISEMIDAAPNDPALRQKRASLLEQVGLGEVVDKESR
jgi:hypothetical protein